jgi:tetratricopeptide (TPR) repeat protein
MHDPSRVFIQAVDFHRSGNLAAAEGLYLQLIKGRSDHFDARHFLGLLRYQQGRLPEALSLIGAALQTNPKFPPALLNYGLVLVALGRREEALASYESALAIQPNYPEALYNRANVLRGLKRHAEALASYDKALAIQPNHAEALYHRGIALLGLRRPVEALASFDRALAVQPSHVKALNNRGSTLHGLNRPDEALASYDKALAIQPSYAEAFYNRGIVLRELNCPAEALASFDKALAIRPDYVDALNNRGVVLRDLNRPDEALASYDKVLAIPSGAGHAEALYNRGATLQDLRRLDEALASYGRAVSLRPDYVEALNNRGIVLADMKRLAEALASYDRALEIKPDFAEAYMNRSGLRLLMGDFEPGWKDFEWRWRTQEVMPWRRNFSKPLWLGGEPLEGRTILLHAEQGYGDAIQFVRYVPFVAARAARVVLEVPAALTALCATIEGGASIVGRGEKLPEFDCHCPLLSLPLALRTTLETIPATIPYLSAPTDRVIKWKHLLPDTGKRRIGIAWAGNPSFKRDRTRSIGLTRLSPLLSVAGIELVVLQKDLQAGDLDILRSNSHLTYVGDAIEDFSDTAAIMSSVDLVISSDTSIVHLAGALGKPVWVLLQYAADWRWVLDREDSPWYPTARLFRQPRIDDWESVVRQVKDEFARAIPGWSQV